MLDNLLLIQIYLKQNYHAKNSVYSLVGMKVITCFTCKRTLKYSYRNISKCCEIIYVSTPPGDQSIKVFECSCGEIRKYVSIDGVDTAKCDKCGLLIVN